MAVLRKLQTVLPRHSLFIRRSHLNYSDIIYDKIVDESWRNELD